MNKSVRHNRLCVPAHVVCHEFGSRPPRGRCLEQQNRGSSVVKNVSSRCRVDMQCQQSFFSCSKTYWRVRIHKRNTNIGTSSKENVAIGPQLDTWPVPPASNSKYSQTYVLWRILFRPKSMRGTRRFRPPPSYLSFIWFVVCLPLFQSLDNSAASVQYILCSTIKCWECMRKSSIHT